MDASRKINQDHCAWRLAAALLCLLALPPVAAGMTLEQAERAALQQQPQLDAIAARVRAAQARAVGAAQLPDPMLTAGVSNLPLDGPERYSLSQDFMTMTTIGLAQEFPRAEKRRLRSASESLSAVELQMELAVLQRSIRRDTALAWLALWSAQHAVQLLDAQIVEAGRERDAATIALRSNQAGQTEVLTATLALELLHDRRDQLQQDATTAQEQLARWTGGNADGTLPDAVPSLAPPVELEQLLAALKEHPELQLARSNIEVRENDVALARADYKPDWRVELMYANRPDFSDMATLQFGIDLPVFPAHRQSAQLASANDELMAVTATHEDHHRMLRADAAAAWRAWSQSVARLQRYDETILPATTARAASATAAYRAGQTPLAGVLDARRGVLEVQLLRLELQTESLRQLIALRYFGA